MARNDKTTRTFMQGAWGGALGFLVGICGPSWLFEGEISLYYPFRIENILSFAPWMLAGGLGALAWHFYLERRIQFRVILLLLIFTLFSLCAAKFSLEKSRYQGEKQAIAALEESFGHPPSLSIDAGIDTGCIYQKITGIGYKTKDVDPDDIPFLLSQLKFFPCLREFTFYGEERLSEADLVLFSNEYPNVVIAYE